LSGKLANRHRSHLTGHHVFRALLQERLLKQYEKSPPPAQRGLKHLADFRTQKGLDHLDAVQSTAFPNIQPIALPASRAMRAHCPRRLCARCCSASPCDHNGAVALPDQDPPKLPSFHPPARSLMAMAASVGGWTPSKSTNARPHQHSIFPGTTAYRLNRSRRPAKAQSHRLLQRDAHDYAYRLTHKKGVQSRSAPVHSQRLCGAPARQ